MRRAMLIAGGITVGLVLHALTAGNPVPALHGSLLTAVTLLPAPAPRGPPIDAP